MRKKLKAAGYGIMTVISGKHWALTFSCLLTAAHVSAAELRINQIQFVGSHNSYKQAMSWHWATLLRWLDADAAQTLDYEHSSLAAQLDLGMRVLEIDVFYDPHSATFPVGHVQLIDMNSHCSPLRACLEQVRRWSDAHPAHIPIWIMFNAKDQPIARLPEPTPFDAPAFASMDAVLEAIWGDRMIRPEDVAGRQWPDLESSRGKVLFLLDEGGAKQALYDTGQPRPMFMNLTEDDPRAAVMVINDPLAESARIRRLIAAGYMVRTRADADTREARSNDTSRRDAAFASGAQAVSTDYYMPAAHFDSSYVVRLPAVARCNPVSADAPCEVSE